MQNQRAYPSTAAIAGHPIHPMLVPLPIGALVLAAGTDLLSWRTGDRFWGRASRWLLGVGAAGAAIAAPFGAIDLATIPRARQLPEAWLHAGGNTCVLGLTVANLALRRGSDRRVESVGLAMSALGAGLLAVTGWLGGELSYRHRIGVAGGTSAGGGDATREDAPETSTQAVDPVSGRTPSALEEGSAMRLDQGMPSESPSGYPLAGAEPAEGRADVDLGVEARPTYAGAPGMAPEEAEAMARSLASHDRPEEPASA